MSFDKKKKKEYDIDPDYQSVFADGVILSTEENDTVRMIFYENTYEFNPNTGIDKDKKTSRLKFEVRMSSMTLERLSAQMFNALLPNLTIDTLKVREMHRLNPNILKEIDKLSNDVSSTTFDTDNPVFNEELNEIHRSIITRILKEDEKSEK